MNYTALDLLNEIKNSFTMTDDEANAARVLIQARAASLGFDSLDEYMSRYHPRGIAKRGDSLPDDYDAFIQFLNKDAAAVITAGKGADFHVFVHECAHAFRRQLAGELREKAEAAFDIKNSEWTEEKEEEFAKRLDQWISRRHPRDKDKLSFMPAGKEYVDNVYRGVERIVDIKPEMEAVFEKLFEPSEYKFDKTKYENLLEQADAGILPENSHISLGMTPRIYEQLGFERLPLAMTGKHLYTTLRDDGVFNDSNDHYHGLGVEILKQIPEQLKKPLYIVQSPNDDAEIISIVELKDKDGKQIIAPIAQRQQGNINGFEVDINLMKSVYGRNKFENWLNAAVNQDRLLYVDKKKTESVLAGQLTRTIQSRSALTSRNILSGHQDVSSFFIENITRYREAVKSKFGERPAGNQVLFKRRVRQIEGQLFFDFESAQEMEDKPAPPIPPQPTPEAEAQTYVFRKQATEEQAQEIYKGLAEVTGELPDDPKEALRDMLRRAEANGNLTLETRQYFANKDIDLDDKEAAQTNIDPPPPAKDGVRRDEIEAEWDRLSEKQQELIDRSIELTDFNDRWHRPYEGREEEFKKLESELEEIGTAIGKLKRERRRIIEENDGQDPRTGGDDGGQKPPAAEIEPEKTNAQVSDERIRETFNRFERKLEYNEHGICLSPPEKTISRKNKNGSIEIKIYNDNGHYFSSFYFAGKQGGRTIAAGVFNATYPSALECKNAAIKQTRFYLEANYPGVFKSFKLQNEVQTLDFDFQPPARESDFKERLQKAFNNLDEFPAFGAWLDFNSRLTPEERIIYNKEALKILDDAKDKPLTHEQRNYLRHYSGFGGTGAQNERGVLYDYYTSPPVARLTWELLQEIEAVPYGAKVLEPSCGTGVFFETAPKFEDVRKMLQFTGVELDERTAAVADKLHEEHEGKYTEIINQSFEEFNLSAKSGDFDLVVGNAPFGERSAALCALDAPDEKSLDNYFVSRGIDNLKDYGVMALITAPGVLENKTNENFRLEMNKKAQFIGALKLPNKSFHHTNTKVEPDILLFRLTQ